MNADAAPRRRLKHGRTGNLRPADDEKPVDIPFRDGIDHDGIVNVCGLDQRNIPFAAEIVQIDPTRFSRCNIVI